MTTAMIIFISQFAVVYLLGIQSLMVRDANCVGAAAGAIFIAISQFCVFSIIGSFAASDLLTLNGLAFLCAAPVAIVASIKTHPYMVKHVFKGRKQ